MNVLRLEIKDLYSALMRVNRQVNARIVRSSTGTPARRKALPTELLSNRVTIQQLLLFARYYLHRIFTQTFQHVFALFRLALDQALVLYSTKTPARHHFVWQEGLRALGVSRCLVKMIGGFVAGVPAIRVTFPIAEIPLPYFLQDPLPTNGTPTEVFKKLGNRLDHEITIARRLARQFSRSGHGWRGIRSRPRISPVKGQISPILESLCPSLINHAFPSHGWQIRGKHGGHNPSSDCGLIPRWGNRYLAWLNDALQSKIQGSKLGKIRKEARVLYRIIRWDARNGAVPETLRDYVTRAAVNDYLTRMPPIDNLVNPAPTGAMDVDINRQEGAVPITIAHLAPGQEIEVGVRHFVNPNLRHGMTVIVDGRPVDDANEIRIDRVLKRLFGGIQRFPRCRARGTPVKVSPLLALINDSLLWASERRGWPVQATRKLWEQLPAPDRAYYMESFGFDPRNKICLDPSGGDFYYEAEFPLAQDPGLQGGGMTISARVQVMGQAIGNRIIFRRGGKEASVSCVHTAIYHGPAREILGADSPEQVENAMLANHLGQSHPIKLSPEEHFVSLKSYVQGIAEMGIGTMLRASYYSETKNPLTLPFGFNSDMQMQVLRAIRTLDPAATNRLVLDLVLHLFETVPEDWLSARFAALDATYGFAHALFVDLETFSGVFELMPRPWLAQWAFSRMPPAGIKQFLVAKGFLPPPASEEGEGVPFNEDEWQPGVFNVQAARNATANRMQRALEEAAEDARTHRRTEVGPALDDAATAHYHQIAQETNRAYLAARDSVIGWLVDARGGVVDNSKYHDTNRSTARSRPRHWFLKRKGKKKSK